MAISRRHLLRGAGILVSQAGLFRTPTAWGDSAAAGSWRTFELTTHLELPVSETVTRAWVPLPSLRSSAFQERPDTTVRCEGGDWSEVGHGDEGLAMVAAEFAPRSAPVLTVTSRVRVRDWAVDLQGPGSLHRLPLPEREQFLKPTRYVPTDGIVRSKALEITSGAKTDEDRARAIYEWIVTHAYRKASVRGCGKGDIGPLLQTGDLGGKCADLSALFVGLARAIELPARELYGIRVAPSRLGYTSLGPATGVVSRAQHCRAEVWLDRFGWTPIDPADVRKVILEEPPGNLSLGDEKVRNARQRLFGSWEMNWVGFNCAQDVSLPGSSLPALPFFMYPQAETAEGRLDSLDPDSFRYVITSAEV